MYNISDDRWTVLLVFYSQEFWIGLTGHGSELAIPGMDGLPLDVLTRVSGGQAHIANRRSHVIGDDSTIVTFEGEFVIDARVKSYGPHDRLVQVAFGTMVGVISRHGRAHHL